MVHSKYKYGAFISYSHKDEKWAAWLHRTLETYQVPKHLVGQATAFGEVPKRLGKIFRDRDELSTSQNLSEELTQALQASACQVVICSPQAAASHWTNEEILAFKRLGREDRIFSLVVEGEPNASANAATAQAECFPPALRFKLGANGTLSDERCEPIAADARPQGDGKQNAKLKLIAGILGIAFDSLKQREQRRRQRRMIAITSAAVCGMVIASGLASFAIVQRNEAQVAKERAESEARVARETRDFLVGLFKVSDPSEALGNTITAREILDKGAARIEQELAGQPAIQATLMETMGSVYTSLGLYKPAASLLESALSRHQALRGARALETGLSMANYGEVLTLSADYNRAEAMYRDALIISLENLGNHSAETAAIKAGLADLLGRMGKYAEAEPLFREALATQRALVSDHSPEVAKSLEGLALNLYHQGNYKDPVPLLREAVALRRTLHAGPHPALAEALNNLGLMLSSGGDYQGAESLYREALEMKRFLLGDLHPEVAMGLNNIAFVMNNRGEHAAAEQMYLEAIEIQRAQLGDDHPDVAMALNNLAFLRYDTGDFGGAVAMARASLDTYRRAVGNEHPSVARGMANLGMWLTESGDYASAESLLRDSLALRRDLFGDDHAAVAASMTLLANLLVATGNFDEAVDLANSARAIYLKALSDTHWRTAVATNAAGAALAGLGKFAEAEPLLVQSYTVLTNDDGALTMFVNEASRRLQALYVAWDKPEIAAKYRGETESAYIFAPE